MTTLDKTVEAALKKYDKAVNWHSYSPHNVDREAAQHRAAAVLAEAVRSTLSSLPAQAVGVKALEWKAAGWRGGDGSEFVWHTFGVGWLWSIELRHDGEVWLSGPGNTHKSYASVEAAKAAAQTDYEARILSALVAPSRPAAVGVTDEMVERVSVPYDGFTGDVIGRYITREGKQGVVVQQDGTRVVHVYGRSRVEAALRSTP